MKNSVLRAGVTRTGKNPEIRSYDYVNHPYPTCGKWAISALIGKVKFYFK